MSYPDDCGGSHGGCIISAIGAQTAAFMHARTLPQLRQEALKFVLHFLGA